MTHILRANTSSSHNEDAGQTGGSVRSEVSCKNTNTYRERERERKTENYRKAAPRDALLPRQLSVIQGHDLTSASSREGDNGRVFFLQTERRDMAVMKMKLSKLRDHTFFSWKQPSSSSLQPYFRDSIIRHSSTDFSHHHPNGNESSGWAFTRLWIWETI